MLNRPATRIEIKLEEDISEYEETINIRKNNNLNNQIKKDEIEFELLTPDSLKKEYFYEHNSNARFSIERINFTPKNNN